jgi:hypothetical protein
LRCFEAPYSGEIRIKRIFEERVRVARGDLMIGFRQFYRAGFSAITFEQRLYSLSRGGQKEFRKLQKASAAAGRNPTGMCF